MFSSNKLKSHFSTIAPLEQNTSTGLFSHTTIKTHKLTPSTLSLISESNLPKKYKNLWYLKQMYDIQSAQREVVAQELFRLLIPGQPKTRLVLDTKNKYWVASKEIENSASLPNDLFFSAAEKTSFNNGIKNGELTGLGEVIIVSLLLQEVDLKMSNLRINPQHRFIKFDGDWCFASLRDKWQPCEIDAATLDKLPHPGKYNPWNWLGIVNGGSKSDSPFIGEDVSTNSNFRAEIHFALLKILTLPNDLIYKFISFYIQDIYAEEIYNEFKNRRDDLRRAALQNENFVTYITSNEAHVQLLAYMDYLFTFKTTHKNNLFNNESEILVLKNQFEKLRLDVEKHNDNVAQTTRVSLKTS